MQGLAFNYKNSVNYKNPVVLLSFIVAAFLLSCLGSVSFAYNWEWDQGHYCTNVDTPDGMWGRWDYDGVYNGDHTTKECCELLCKICPVYANTGTFQKTYTDLSVPGVGPALQITRSYSSQEWASTLLGYGWTFNLGRRLIILRNRAGDKIVGVRLQTGEKNFYKENPDGSLERLTDYGATYDLVKNEDETYTLSRRNGSRVDIQADGKISRIVDSNNNILTFEYNAVGCLARITNASGNYVDFVLGPNGKIASVADNLGRVISYAYDDHGNLIVVTDPMGYTTQYLYNSRNLLTQIVDARGNTVHTISYNNDQPPKVASFVEKGDAYTISYYSDRTVKTDSHGNSWTYYFNDVGTITMVIDPLGNQTTNEPNYVTATSLDWKQDANGNRTTFTYDSQGHIISVGDPLGNTMQYTYDPITNNIATKTDELGRVTSKKYDTHGNLTVFYQAYGTSEQTVVSFSYDAYGNMTGKTDELGSTWHYTCDALGNRTYESDPLGNIRTYSYDNFGNLLSETDESGHTTTYEYDLAGHKTKQIDPAGNEILYGYDAVGNLVSQTMPDGNSWKFEYDQYGNLVRVVDPLSNSTTKTYDQDGNILSETDQNGKVTYYQYDPASRLIKVVRKINDTSPTEDSDDIVWQYGYDAVGNRTLITDPLGTNTRFAYDALGRMISKTMPDGSQILYAYDSAGNVLTQSLPNANAISYTYDLHNRAIDISDSVGVIGTVSYNDLGQVISRTDGNGNTTHYSYDGLGRLIETTDPQGEKNVYSYDAIGNLVSVTDREEQVTQYSYDSLDRRISETDPLGNQTTMQYDSIGNLISATDANGNARTYEYNGMGMLISEVSADGASAEFNYDPVGNLISKVNRDGNVINYVYDDAYRVQTIDYPGSNDSNYGYNKLGLPLSGNNAAASISMAYDSMRRLTQYVQNGRTINYSFDIQNGQTTMSRPSGRVITLNVDLRGRLVSIEDGGQGNLTSYEYDNGNQLQRRICANGVETGYSYNSNNLVVDMVHSQSGTTILGYHYLLDREGHRLLAQDLRDSAQSEEYAYDNAYRLLNYKMGIPSGNQIPSPSSVASWQLDPVSNWLQRTEDGVTSYFSSNEVNEYTQADGSQYFYDHRGNLLDDETHLYTYDYENRLLEVKESSGQILAQYSYGPFGRRIEKVLSGQTIEYVYCNSGVAEEYSNGALNKEFVYGIGLADKIVFSNGNAHFYLGNSLGSVMGITDDVGTLVESYQYSPYGSPVIYDASGSEVSTSSIGNPYLFAGMRYDQESDLYHTQYRQYSDQIGRFLGRDPVRSINPYVYADSDPINLVDPLGLWVEVPGEKDVWMADDGDTLWNLAVSITGDGKDWQCIWPKEEMRSPSSQYWLTLRKCDKFDVSNLTARTGPSIKLSVADSDDALAHFFGAASYTASNAYQYIKSSCGEGRTPIFQLIVVGHSASWADFISKQNGNNKFTAGGLINKSYRGVQTYTRAKAKKGPIRCWFARNAKVYGAACSSTKWANSMADNVLRSTAACYGTKATVTTSYHQFLWWTWGYKVKIGNGPWHTTINGFLNDTGGWRKYSGGL